MNFNKKLAVAVSGAVLLMAGQVALADSATDIVDALVMKGVLTEEEGRLITKGHTSKTNVTPVLKEKDNNFTIESPNGNNSISLTGRIHFDARTYEDNYGSDAGGSSVTASPSSTAADTFDIRRARLGVKYKFAKNYSGEIVFNTVGAVNVLDVAYMDVSWFDKAKFRIGQFKMPFSLEQLTSSNNIDFVERSFVDSYIPAKEIGAQVFGEPTKGMTYALAVSNGLPGANAVGSEADNRQDGKDVIGRLTFNAAEAAGNKEAVYHAGVAFAYGDSPIGTGLGGNRSTEARGVSFYTAPTINPMGTNSKTIERMRYGVEGAIASGPFKIQGQYSVTSQDFALGGTSTNKYDLDIKTYYVQALWTLTGEKWADRYKAGAFGALKPKNDFDSDKFTGGAWEIGGRYSKFDASDWNLSALAAGPDSGVAQTTGIATKSAGYTEADAYTVGVKFVANPNFRIMADYVYTDFKNRISAVSINGKAITDESALLVRTQIMF
ncbi:OprO/OprP family phosphate-selective porin [Candidatus Methylopumilus universalis]|uniref:OprO/OprP family phosphate-selective porin n=1 Tax=Candidatus Methylopumilus universalis TaxID=2588536 RepID=UPI003BEF4AD6